MRSTTARHTTYDAFDRVVAQTDALGQITYYVYDDTNRSLHARTPEGIQTTTIQNRHGETVRVIDGENNPTDYDYDHNGNLVKITDALGHISEHSYDQADRQVQTIVHNDGNDRLTVFEYDAANRLITRTVDPAGLALSNQYRYDAKGNTVHSIDANGVITATQYDNKGQVTAVIVDPYDAATNPDGLHLKTVYAYDGEGRP